MGQIAILTRGLWRLRGEIAALTGLSPVRWEPWRRPAFEAVAGWGHKPTADRARRLASQSGAPYIAFEDGPLRSVRPGPSQAPMSLVMDRTGIYYRAGSGSDLVSLVASPDWFTPDVEDRALGAVEALRRLKLSKYNSGPERSPRELGLEERSGWIGVLGVDPDFRGQAVGRRLAEAMLAHFRGKGAVTVRTLVDEKLAGIGQFFISLGFEPAPLQPFVKRL